MHAEPLLARPVAGAAADAFGASAAVGDAGGRMALQTEHVLVSWPAAEQLRDAN